MTFFIVKSRLKKKKKSTKWKKKFNQILLVKYITLKMEEFLQAVMIREPKRVTGQLLNYLILHSSPRVMTCDQFQHTLRFLHLWSKEKYSRENESKLWNTDVQNGLNNTYIHSTLLLAISGPSQRLRTASHIGPNWVGFICICSLRMGNNYVPKI